MTSLLKFADCLMALIFIKDATPLWNEYLYWTYKYNYYNQRALKIIYEYFQHYLIKLLHGYSYKNECER